MRNNFQEWQATLEREFPLPEELENRVLRHANTFSFFGKVVELFIPNALQTVARMVGADAPAPTGRLYRSPESEPEWRQRPEGPAPFQNGRRTG